MLPFYGRKLSRKTKNFSLFDLNKNQFFFDEQKINSLKREVRSKKTKINLEIGFGKGDNLIFQSKIHECEFFLAIDPYLSGALRLRQKIEINNITNIFFSDFTFSKFFDSFKDVNFTKIYILFPDPWPKKKHNKRRLINVEFVKKLNSITSKKSKIFIATDHEDYSTQILKSFSKEKYFKLGVKRDDNFSFEENKIYPTKYFKKAKKEKRKINFFLFTK